MIEFDWSCGMIMPDLYFDDHEPSQREEQGSYWILVVVTLCAVIIGFILFFMIYAYIWSQMVESLTQHAAEMTTFGVIIVAMIVFYVVRNRSLERKKIMAAS